LAKTRRSVHVSSDSPLPQLLSVYSMLGLAPPGSLRAASIREAWAWATAAWSIEKVPKRLNLRVNG
jgi:hypothetical protein